MANGLAGVKRIAAEEVAEYEPHCRALQRAARAGDGHRGLRAGGRDDGGLIRDRGAEIRTGAGRHAPSAATARASCSRRRGATSHAPPPRQLRGALLRPGGGDDGHRPRGAHRPVPRRVLHAAGRSAGRSCGTSSIPCPIPSSRSSACTSRAPSTATWRRGPTRCSPSRARATPRHGAPGASSRAPSATPGFWNMARRYWQMGGYELYRSASKAAFVRSLQKLVPEIDGGDIERGGAGVRAQAVSPDGSLVDDFKISVTAGAVHVVNAPSPAATASLAIGRHIADLAADTFGMRGAGSRGRPDLGPFSASGRALARLPARASRRRGPAPRRGACGWRGP